MTAMVIAPSVRLMTTFLDRLDVHHRFACTHTLWRQVILTIGQGLMVKMLPGQQSLDQMSTQLKTSILTSANVKKKSNLF